MNRQRQQTVTIPGLVEPVSLALPPELAALREKTLRLHKDDLVHWEPPQSVVIAEAEAWQSHGRNENCQIWCARRFAIRMAHIPLELETGETIVGKPLVRGMSDPEKADIDRINSECPDMPSCPGGDAGHFHPNYEKVLRLGVGGLLDRIAACRDAAVGGEANRTFYDSCELAMKAFQSYIRRVADACKDKAAESPEASAHWQEMAAICEKVAVDPPTTFHEACQLMYFVLIAGWVGEDHVMTCYGRMDRTLAPFYEADIEASRTDPQQALQLIAAMYIQLNRICPIGLADAVLVGGRDGAGHDVTNTLTYLCLAARQATWLRNPSLAIAWHEETPDELMQFAMEMLASGINCPAFFNDETISVGLQDHGVSVEDSHNYMNSTCVEIKTAGSSNIWVATEYVNCPKALLEGMRREAQGECPPAADLDELEVRLQTILQQQVANTAKELNRIWNDRADTWSMPFASCLINDCLERGLDHDRGGCRYNWAENSFMGLANLADGLTAIDELVYRNGEMTLAEFYAVCESNFEGREALRQRIVNDIPSYGNGDERVDSIACRWADFACSTTESCNVAGHRYVPGFFCSQFHAWLGFDTPATPDGRLAEKALANGAGAHQGREFSGPTASALSTTAWSHRKALGGLVHNVRFSGSVFATAESRQAARAVIETYLQRGGFEIQVNVLSADTLRAAQKRPEEYRDLLVRVAGYSNYFTSLMESLQEDVITRTEFAL
jgi:formate C-acetyltransferase